MRGYIFLVVNLAISSAFARGRRGGDIVNIGEDKDIPEANKGSLHDDILQPAYMPRSAVNAKDRLWTSPISYVLEKDLELNAKGVILRALDQFRLKSCLDFKPRDDEEDYISVRKLDGCYSYVGKVQPKGQVLSIGRFCDMVAIVEHEFLHALGFYHEHTRYDRDDYVTILYQNIIPGFELNFIEVSSDESITQGVPYDYLSVMHYSKNAFANSTGPTIVTKYPKFQDLIGQRLDMSPPDAAELNLLYKCKSTIAFKMSCSFSNGDMCQMNHCSQGGSGWEMVTRVEEGPRFDHTNLPSGSGDVGMDVSYFMHASTASGQEGDSARLETHKMSPNRKCHVQCLQFYFYHSGNELDCLNIWIREFRGATDSTGTRRLMGQITGPRTSHWQIHHVSLNATKQFQVEFEFRKGAGNSSGGFSIDDINLSETECPHAVMQVNDFMKVLSTSRFRTPLYSQRYYSRGGYAFAVGVMLYRYTFGLFAQLLSGENDDQLEWPCRQRQVTVSMLDQKPNILLQMSKQRSFTSDGSKKWDNPRETGVPYVDGNETIYAGDLLGRRFFASSDELSTRDFIKGGNVIFVFSFQDITPLVNGSDLPCPHIGPVKVTHPPRDLDNGPCPARSVPTTTHPPPKTTTHPPPKTTTHPPPKTTTHPHPQTTTHPPPKTTDDKSVFGFSAGLVCSPVLTLLLPLMLLIP